MLNVRFLACLAILCSFGNKHNRVRDHRDDKIVKLRQLVGVDEISSPLSSSIQGHTAASSCFHNTSSVVLLQFFMHRAIVLWIFASNETFTSGQIRIITQASRLLCHQNYSLFIAIKFKVNSNIFPANLAAFKV